MKEIKFIEGSKIYLRPFEERDAELVYFGKNNSKVRETLFLFEPITRTHILNELHESSNNKETVLFSICSQEKNIAVGQTALLRIDYISRAAIFYIAIYNPDYWSKGYGKEATSLVTKYAFDVLNLNRIQLHVSVENKKGVAAYEKSGFKVEGRLREAMYHDNRYVDFLVMSILRKDFYALNK